MRRALFAFTTLLALVGGSAALSGVAQACETTGCDSAPFTFDAAGTAELVALANQERGGAGLPPVAMRSDITDVAVAHTNEMAKSGSIYHNDEYFTAATRSRLALKALGENVGMAGSVRSAHQALMDSPAHRANIMNGSFTVGGFAVVSDGGSVYVTQNFGTPSGGVPKAASPAPPVAAPVAPRPAPPAKPKPPAPAAPRPAPAPRAAAKPAPKPAPTPTTVPAAVAPPVAPDPATTAESPSTTIPRRVFDSLADGGRTVGPLALPAVLLLSAATAAVIRALRQSRARVAAAA